MLHIYERTNFIISQKSSRITNKMYSTHNMYNNNLAYGTIITSKDQNTSRSSYPN